MLRAVPGKRWQVVLYLDNNSANTVVPLIDCRFTNSGKLVEETHVLVPAVGAGLRVGMVIHGPKTDLFRPRPVCGEVALAQHRVTAVNRDGGAGHEIGRRRGKEHRDAGEVVGYAPAAGRRAPEHRFVSPWICSRARLVSAVSIQPGRMAFT